MLRFLTDELQDAEDVEDRGAYYGKLLSSTENVKVWILGHVPSGWDGTNPLLNPTNLCLSITYHLSICQLTDVRKSTRCKPLLTLS